jgi:hypothetical protein
MKRLFQFFAVALLVFFVCGNSSAEQLRDGDLIFQTTHSSSSVAIQKATHSKYSHMGIIFVRGTKPYIYEAIGPVQYTPFQNWTARGDGGRYVVKRLAEADKVLNSGAVAKLRKTAAKFEGKPYDIYFGWSDNRIYCSELVWKIYDRGLGIRIGRLQKLHDFDLSDPLVKAKMKERYGNRVPMEEPVISPGEMFSSNALTVVVEQ